MIASLLSVGYVMFFSCTVVSIGTTSSSANFPCKPKLIRKIRSLYTFRAYALAKIHQFRAYGTAISVGALSCRKKPASKDCAST
ncbi:MAG: hypothetical protein ABL921_34035, partial [Pirellula sp.]